MRHGRLLFLVMLMGAFSPPGAVYAADAFAAHQKSPSEAATVGEFVEACGRDAFHCEYKMRNAAINKINTQGATSICIRDKHPRQPVLAWLKAHPETYQMPTEDGLYQAYVSLYPCP